MFGISERLDDGQAALEQLGKLESLYAALLNAKTAEFARQRRTLAGALVTLTATDLVIDRAPARAAAVRSALTTGKYGRRGAPKRR